MKMTVMSLLSLKMMVQQQALAVEVPVRSPLSVQLRGQQQVYSLDIHCAVTYNRSAGRPVPSTWQ